MADQFRRPWQWSAFRRLRRRAGLALLALALGFGSAPPAPAAQAAPAPQETITNLRFYLNIHQPEKYCAGQTYAIPVTPLVELNGVRADGRRFNDQDRIVTGVAIQAETQDQSIATVTPARLQSGSLNIHRAISIADQPRLGAVTFQLNAQRAGTTNLYLTAQVPPRWSGGAQRYFGPQGMPAGFPITVVDCEYRVTVTYNWQLSGVGYRYWTIGTMNAKVTASDPEFYGGDGLLDFFLNHYDVTCSERLSYQNPTHITVRRLFATDELELTFSMEAANVTPGCANSYLLANSPFTDPAGPWNGGKLTFPTRGGTRRIRLTANAPVLPPTGWATITVQPVTPGGR